MNNEMEEEEGKESNVPTELVPEINIIDRPSRRKLCTQFFGCYWKSFVVFLTPLVYIPIMYIDSSRNKELQCVYCILILATFWVTEALPAVITALLPVILFPGFGILDTETVCKNYLKETVMMFLGGLMVAVSIEYSGLHVRFALKFLLLVGCSHQRLTLGIFLVTSLISMWINNTAATAMMAPIVTAIIITLEEEGMCTLYRPSKKEGEGLYPSRTTLCYFLGLAYSSTLGGTGTYVGTGTNLVARGYIETDYPDYTPAFHTWMAAAIPPLILGVFSLWFWMNLIFLGMVWKGGCDPEVMSLLTSTDEEKKKVVLTIRKVIKEKYDLLGDISWNEYLTGLLFLLAVFLWLFRAPQFMPGWADVIIDAVHIPEPNATDEEITKDKNKLRSKDSSAAMFATILMFIMPGSLSFLRFFNPKAKRFPNKTGPALLTWEEIHKKIPWGLLFIVGGGFSIAEASEKSGMSKMIGEGLKALKGVPDFWIMLLACFMASNLTEFTSNVAVMNILAPVLLQMVEKLNININYLFVPTAICCSFSFMLPVGTPPNAVVAGMVNIPTKEMIIAGTVPTIFTLIYTVIWYHFIAPVLLTKH